MKLGISILLGAVFAAKRTGKGRLGRRKVYVELMEIITDSRISLLVGGSIDQFLLRLLCGKTDYPYSIFSFERFEQSIGNYLYYQNYLFKMKKFCNTVLDENKIEQLVYTLLEVVRQDSSISTILYGCAFVPKEKFFGRYAHPKKICVEALLLGLLYHVHKNSAKSENIELLEVPEKLTFHAVRYEDESSLALEMPINMIENIHENAKRQKSVKMKYSLEFSSDEVMITELHEEGNIFLYGTGGVGKTTVLLNILGRYCSDETVPFYLSIYRYKNEIHENFQTGNCWILLQILLKYHYQYEYQTYETLIANEGEDVVLQQLTELNNLLKNNPENWAPQYILLLDGMNEMSSDLQKNFAAELHFICQAWKNVRIIITGRIVPDYEAFTGFRQIEVCGIPDEEKNTALSELQNFSDISCNERLMEILKIPLFLNMYLKNQGSDNPLNTRGEILDSYISDRCFQKNEVMRFVVQYALPVAANKMFARLGFRYDISRTDLLDAIKEASSFYLGNERIYQNYIAPQKINRKSVVRFWRKNDFVEIIINNTGFLQPSIPGSHKLIFIHQYYRDYFAAKHILNLIEAFDVSYAGMPVDRAEKLEQSGLTDAWYGGFSWFGGEEVYRLIGEICGDYKNAACANFIYHRTVLDRLLDMVRGDNAYRTSENVILTMSLVRNNVICGANFSQMNLPVFLPGNIFFSDNGRNPCLFKNSIVKFLPESDALNFQNCDFTESLLLENEENLRRMGAIVDEEDGVPDNK